MIDVEERSRPVGLNVYAALCISILTCSSLAITENSLIDVLGRASFYIMSALNLVLVAYHLTTKHDAGNVSTITTASMTFMLFVVTAYTIANMNAIAVTFLVQFVIIIGSFILFTRIGAAGSNRSLLGVAILCCAILALYAAWAITHPGLAQGEGWAGGLSNQNLFGMCVFMIASLAMIMLSLEGRATTVRMLAILAMAIVLIYMSRSRSNLLAVAMAIITFVSWKPLCRIRIAAVGYFMAVVGFVLYLIYSGADRLSPSGFVYQVLYSISKEYGKNVDSGRSVIWNFAMDSISDRPVFGWGTGLTTTSVLNTGLSFHNWYLTIAYHFGMFGILIYAVILSSIWLTLTRYGQYGYARLAASALVGVMMTQTYEVSLTQNNLNIGLLYWIIFGLVMGRIYSEEKQRRYNPAGHTIGAAGMFRRRDAMRRETNTEASQS